MALVEIRGVSKRFPVRAGLMRRVVGWVRAVDHVSLDIEAGRTLGLVGESGCGKTTLGRMVMALLPVDSGEIRFDENPVAESLKNDRRGFRRRVQMVFQDPMDSLDPRWTVGQSVAEPLQALRFGSSFEIDAQVRWALKEVQLTEEVLGLYPHELSGGMRQRVGIARALAVRPDFIVCDEPVSSLDLSIQAQILRLLRKLQDDFGIALLFISHDLSAVEAVSHRIAVMYLGAVVEVAPAAELLARPWHPYTEALLAAVPRPEPGGSPSPVKPLSGEPPSAAAIPSGCRFRTRCPLAQERCTAEEPALLEKAPGHWVACHFRP